MNDSPPAPKERDARNYLAAEQTFLAWIRTGLSFMGFGFVVARFGLFLQQLAIVEPVLRGSTRHGISIWFGTGLIVMGVAMNLFGAWDHVRLVRELNRGETDFTRPSRAAIITSVILGLVGLAMAIYLVSV